MDEASLEEIIQVVTLEGQSGSSQQKEQVAQYIERIKQAENRWSIGLQLLYAARNQISQFFGLALLREYLAGIANIATPPTEQEISIRSGIRESLLEWTRKNCTENVVKTDQNDNAVIPTYMWNTVCTCIALVIKNDFPELWPHAFSALLQFGRGGGHKGAEMVVKVMMEIEVEVVMFNENRSRQEVSHNVIIKDAMRSMNVVHDLLAFLCQVAVSSLSTSNQDSLCEQALVCLSELFGWIDINLVVTEALPTVYQVVQRDITGEAVLTEGVRGAAFGCLYELVKKGMDPVNKVQLVQSIGLDQVLAALLRVLTTSNEDTQQQQQKQLYITCKQLSLFVDMLVLELLRCWYKFEDEVVFMQYAQKSPGSGVKTSTPKSSGGGFFDTTASNPGSNTPINSASSGLSPEEIHALRAMVPVTSELLATSMQLLLQLFGSANRKVSVSVYPAMHKVVHLMSRQQQKTEAINACRGAEAGLALPGAYFLSLDHLNPILSAIFMQIQFPEDFDFNDEEGDEEVEVLDSKLDCTKLFVNCCRYHPDRCQELITAIFQSLPHPLSTAQFAPLEAALCLLYAYLESGITLATLRTNQAFMSLIQALHTTDVAHHTHTKVAITYFEVSLRYIKLVDLPCLEAIVQVLVGGSGIQSPVLTTRCRCASILLKVMESMEGKSYVLLEGLGTCLVDLVMHSAQGGFQLTEAAELHLLESIAIMSASSHERDERLIPYQVQLLSGSMEAMTNQLSEILSNPNFSQYVHQYVSVVAHKVNSISSLTKGFSSAKHSSFTSIFETVAATIVSVLNLLPQFAPVRAKVIQFCHRLMVVLGNESVVFISDCLANIILHADTTDIDITIGLINQFMGEYQIAVVQIISRHYLPIMQKFDVLLAGLAPAQGTASTPEAPHMEVERFTMQRSWLGFLQHIATQNCYAVIYYNEAHSRYFADVVYGIILSCVSYGDMRAVNPAWGRTATQSLTLPLRKAAISTLMGLTKAILYGQPSNTNQQGGVVASLAPTPVPVPTQTQTLLQTLLYENALPAILRSCGSAPVHDPTSHPDMPISIPGIKPKDAAAQGVIIEIASLLWAVHQHIGNGAAAYFQPMLASIGWTPPAILTLLTHLTEPNQCQGGFRDKFRVFIRTNS